MYYWCFQICCWRRLLRVSWIAKRSNQSILKEINPEYLLEGLMLKLKFQYFGHQMRRADSLKKTLILGKIKGKRRKVAEDEDITNWMVMSLSKLGRQRRTEELGKIQSVGPQKIEHDLASEQQQRQNYERGTVRPDGVVKGKPRGRQGFPSGPVVKDPLCNARAIWSLVGKLKSHISKQSLCAATESICEAKHEPTRHK